jgi:hypothetical protein
MLIVGPTGAGKSVLLALMAMQFRRYGRAQVFAFDFGGSIRAAALGMGGDWQDLGGTLADEAGDGVQLQPLAHIDAPAERAWAAEWLAAIFASEGVAVDPQAKEHIWSALGSLASAPIGERTLTGLAVLLQSQQLKQRSPPTASAGRGAGCSTPKLNGSAKPRCRRSRPRAWSAPARPQPSCPTCSTGSKAGSTARQRSSSSTKAGWYSTARTSPPSSANG